MQILGIQIEINNQIRVDLHLFPFSIKGPLQIFKPPKFKFVLLKTLK